jgi:hypothetical protein
VPEGELVDTPLGDAFALTDLDASVHGSLVATYPEQADGTGAKRFEIYRPADSKTGKPEHRVKAAKVFLPNLLSLYVFQSGPAYYLEVKGLSGGRMLGAESLGDRTERFASSQALVARIESLKALQPTPFAPPRPRPFRSRDSVAVVLSESTHRAVKDHVEQYVAHLRDQEQRSASRVVPVPDRLVAERNPARLRDFLRQQELTVDGVMLVGPDIAPFELVSTQGNVFHYASTDLPYGEFSSAFWDAPIPKSDPRYAERAYRSQNSIYRLTEPTPFTFDIDAFARDHLGGSRTPYLQTRWVTRWVGTDPSPAALQKQFAAFVEERLRYRPPSHHNVLGMAGGTGPLYDPGPDTDMQTVFEHSHDRLMTHVPSGSRVQTVHEADLGGAIRRVDAVVTFLNVSEHGTPEAVGDVKAWHLSRVAQMPALVHLEACANGMWAYTSLKDSIVANLFAIPRPPLAVVACQTIKAFPTMGGPDGVTRAENVLVDDWMPGQTIGDRQVQSNNGHLRSWDANATVARRPFPGEAFLQLFASASVFGDGTAEL